MPENANEHGGMKIPVEKLLQTIGRLTVENEMLRELVAKKILPMPATPATTEDKSGG